MGDPTLEKVQAAINAAGYEPPLAVDGVDGPKTRAGVMWWQGNHGLTVDGIVGPLTLASMPFGAAAPSASPLRPNASSESSSIPGLHQSVIDALPSLFGPLEGPALPYMYADSKDYVTTGTGNKIDPVGLALELPWENPDGSRTSQSDIEAAWQKVKNAWPGVQSTASQTLTDIRLSKSALDALLRRTMAQFRDVLVKRYPNYPKWPADAQMAVMSISWAWGPGFSGVWGANGHAFDAAVNATHPDFVKAAHIMATASAHEENINRGVLHRDAMNAALFANAANVLRGGYDYGRLYYPGKVARGVLAVVATWLGLGALVAAGIMAWRRYHGS